MYHRTEQRVTQRHGAVQRAAVPSARAGIGGTKRALLLQTRKKMQANVSDTAQPLQRSRQVRKRSGALHSGGQSRGRQIPKKAVKLMRLSLLNAARRGPVATYTVRCCVSVARSWRIS